uniref:Uncharacterized protein n=1 Tax=Avena sativa TaxID=4498 RepID=A0ACD5Y1B1_AVESA
MEQNGFIDAEDLLTTHRSIWLRPPELCREEQQEESQHFPQPSPLHSPLRLPQGQPSRAPSTAARRLDGFPPLSSSWPLCSPRRTGLPWRRRSIRAPLDCLAAHPVYYGFVSQLTLPKGPGGSAGHLAPMLHIKSEPGTREEETQEHEQKVNKYQAILAARLKAKYFSNKAFDGGKIFEAETIVDGETIQSSRWPCTSSFTNPVNFFRDKNSRERDSPSLVADSSAKNDSPSVGVEASQKNNANALAAENNLTPGKGHPSKET